MTQFARTAWTTATPAAFSLAFVLFGLSAQAQFPVLATTFSNFSGQEVSATSVTLYASRIGRGSGGVDYGYCTTTSGVCNTCQDPAGSTLRKCNASAIDWSSQAVISFPATVTGIPRIMQDNGTTEIGPSATSVVVAGATAEIRVNWSDLCTYVTGDANCTTTNGSKNVVIGIDPFTGGSYSGNLSTATVRQTVSINVVTNLSCDTTLDTTNCAGGISKFDMRAGDGKAYLRNLTTTNTSFPIVSGQGGGAAAIWKLRVYFAPASVPDLASSNPCATDITSVRNGSNYFETEITKPSDAIELTSDAVKGLTNLTKYVFKLALVDKAQNVYFFTPDEHCGDLRSGTPAIAQATYGNHASIPDEVTGLLADGNSCFIATAAYGSSMDPHVQTFRDFRDRVLMTFSFGQRLVSWYYQHSPVWAAKIESSASLRWFARTLLWPLWLLSALVLHLGPLLTLLVLASAALVTWAFWQSIGAPLFAAVGFSAARKSVPPALHGAKK